MHIYTYNNDGRVMTLLTRHKVNIQVFDIKFGIDFLILILTEDDEQIEIH